MRRATRQVIVLTALFGMGALVAWLAFSDMNKSLVYYLTADELLAKANQTRGATLRLGGLVQQKTVNFTPQTLQLSFQLGNQAVGGPAVTVESSGTPPQMFREGSGAVVEGIYDGKVFHAERVMVKHSNEYRPPPPGTAFKNAYTTLRPPD